MFVKLIEHFELIERGDVGAGRTRSKLRAKPVEHDRRSLRSHLHRSIRSVAHPSRQTELAPRFAHEPAESDTLHATTYEHVHPHSRAPAPDPAPAPVTAPTV